MKTGEPGRRMPKPERSKVDSEDDDDRCTRTAVVRNGREPDQKGTAG